MIFETIISSKLTVRRQLIQCQTLGHQPVCSISPGYRNCNANRIWKRSSQNFDFPDTTSIQRRVMSENLPLARADVPCATLCSKSNFEQPGFRDIPIHLAINSPPKLSTCGLEKSNNHSNISYPCSVANNTSSIFDKRDGSIENDSSNYPSLIKELLEASEIHTHFDIYRKMIVCIPETDRAMALQMLQWVSYAARELSAPELLSVTSYQIDSKLEEADIKKISGGLLNINSGKTVNLVHSTLQNYLDSRGIDDDDDVLGWVRVSGMSHEMIASTCLQLLQPIDLLESLDIEGLVNRLETMYDDRRHALHFYAIRYWRFHYILAESQSYCLPGMVHQKLRDGCNDGDDHSNCKAFQRRRGDEIMSPNLSNQTLFAPFDAALRIGARSGMVKLVKLELQRGASPNTPDSHDMTPLDHAAAAGSCAVIRLLIDYGANANAVSRFGKTALYHAIANGRIEAVKLLQRLAIFPSNTESGSYGNRSERESLHPVYQKLSLAVLVRNCCSHCDNIQIQYIVSKLPRNKANAVSWPPIFVTDQPASQAKCTRSAMQNDSQLCQSTIISDRRTTVTWFPGIEMYRALGIAAKFGMSDMLKLLLLAGNEIDFLRRNENLSKLIAEMSIS